MKQIGEIAVIIQARLGSERTPRKMTRPFAGSSLLDIALPKMLCSAVFYPEQFFLAVHEEELAGIGSRHGVNVFRRSECSARSEGKPLSELYEWWDQLPFTYAVLVNACAPLLRIATVDAFIDHYRTMDGDGLFGVLEKRDYFWNVDGVLLTSSPGRGAVMNTKVVEPTYEAAHCLYAGRMAAIGEGRWMGNLDEPGDIELFPMNHLEAFDIDYPWQFEAAEALYRAGIVAQASV